MKTFAEFETWFSTELQKHPMIAKSNPLSLNELCYILRMSGLDFSVNWRTDDGFASIPSVQEAFISSRTLALKVEIFGYDENVSGGVTYRSIVVRIVSNPAQRGEIEKAIADWKPELNRINARLGCCELLAGLAEEASELSQAALKLRRAFDKHNPTPISAMDASDKLNEEFADVILCAAALGVNNDDSIERYVREKAARWSTRLEV